MKTASGLAKIIFLLGFFFMPMTIYAAPNATIVKVKYPSSVKANEEFRIEVKGENPGTDLIGYGTVTISLESDDGFSTVLDTEWDGVQVIDNGTYVNGIFTGTKNNDKVIEGVETDWEGDHWFNINGEDHTLKVNVKAPSSGGNIHFYARVTFVDESWQLIDNDPSYSSYSDWAHYVKRYTIQVIDPDTNPPSVPKLQSPSNGAETSDTTVSLNWTDSSDSGSGLDHYQVQVDNSSSFSSPEFKAYPTSSNDTTSSLSDGLYYWRVQAVDNVGNWSSWSSDQKFRVDTTAPSVPVLQTPANGSSTTDQTPHFNWASSSDSGSGVNHYDIEIYDKDLSWADISDTASDSNYTPSSNIPHDKIYWRVRAVDDAGNTSAWSSEWWFDLVEVFNVETANVSLNKSNATTDDTCQRWGTINGSGDGTVSYRWEHLPPGGSWEQLLTHTSTMSNGSATISAAEFDALGPEGQHGFRVVVTSPNSATSNTVYLNVTENKPDLQVSQLDVSPNTVVPGDSITVSGTVTNSGSGGAYGTYVGFYLSTNSTWDNHDTFIGHQETSSLSPGDSQNYNMSVAIPSSTSAGNYYLIAYADYMDEDPRETNEGNNTRSSSIVNVTENKPDLEINTISISPDPPLYADDSIVNIKVNFQNNGSSDIETPFLLKARLNGTPVFEKTYNSLNAAASINEVVWNHTLSGPSSYIISAEIDADDDISENNEGNNRENASFYVLIQEQNPPPIPQLYSPDDGAVFSGKIPELKWENVSDPEGNGDEFDCEVATDSSFTNVVRSIYDTNTSSYTVDPELSPGRYYWRVRSKDMIPNISEWSVYRYFDVDDTGITVPKEWGRGEEVGLYNLFNKQFSIKTYLAGSHLIIFEKVGEDDIIVIDRSLISTILLYHNFINQDDLSLNIESSSTIQQETSIWDNISEAYRKSQNGDDITAAQEEIVGKYKRKLALKYGGLVASTLIGAAIGAHFGLVGSIPGAMIGLGIGIVTFGFSATADIMEVASDGIGDDFIIDERVSMIHAIAYLDGKDIADQELNDLTQCKALSENWEKAGTTFSDISFYTGVVGNVVGATRVESLWNLAELWGNLAYSTVIESPLDHSLSYHMDIDSIKLRMALSVNQHSIILQRLACTLAALYDKLGAKINSDFNDDSFGRLIVEISLAKKLYLENRNELSYSVFKRANNWVSMESEQALYEYLDSDLTSVEEDWTAQYNKMDEFINELQIAQVNYNSNINTAKDSYSVLNILLFNSTDILVENENNPINLNVGVENNVNLTISNLSSEDLTSVQIDLSDFDDSGVILSCSETINIFSQNKGSLNCSVRMPIIPDKVIDVIKPKVVLNYNKKGGAFIKETELKFSISSPVVIANIKPDSLFISPGQTVGVEGTILSTIDESLIITPTIYFESSYSEQLSPLTVETFSNEKIPFYFIWQVPANFEKKGLLSIKFDIESNLAQFQSKFPTFVYHLPKLDGNICDFNFLNAAIVSPTADEEIARRIQQALSVSQDRFLILEGLTAGELLPIMQENNLILIGGHEANPLVEDLIYRGLLSENLWLTPGDASIHLIEDPFYPTVPQGNLCIVVAGYSINDTYASGIGLLAQKSNTPCVLPIINPINDISLLEGTSYTSVLPVISEEAKPVVWSLDEAPGGMTINNGTGIVTWPNPIVSGSPHRVVIQATNNAGSDTEEWYLTVTSTPDPPVINDIPDHSIEEGSPYTSPTPDVAGTLPITWSLDDGPSGSSINASTGVVAWSDPVLTGSPHLIRIRATNSADTDTEDWQLTVNLDGPPENPTITTYSAVTHINEKVLFDVSALGIGSEIIQFQVDAGDGNVSEWFTGNSYNHRYTAPGDFEAKVRAKDETGNVSDWSASHIVSVLDTFTGNIIIIDESNPTFDSSSIPAGTQVIIRWTKTPIALSGDLTLENGAELILDGGSLTMPKGSTLTLNGSSKLQTAGGAVLTLGNLVSDNLTDPEWWVNENRNNIRFVDTQVYFYNFQTVSRSFTAENTEFDSLAEDATVQGAAGDSVTFSVKSIDSLIITGTSDFDIDAGDGCPATTNNRGGNGGSTTFILYSYDEILADISGDFDVSGGRGEDGYNDRDGHISDSGDGGNATVHIVANNNCFIDTEDFDINGGYAADGVDDGGDENASQAGKPGDVNLLLESWSSDVELRDMSMDVDCNDTRDGGSSRENDGHAGTVGADATVVISAAKNIVMTSVALDVRAGDGGDGGDGDEAGAGAAGGNTVFTLHCPGQLTITGSNFDVFSGDGGNGGNAQPGDWVDSGVGARGGNLTTSINCGQFTSDNSSFDFDIGGGGDGGDPCDDDGAKGGNSGKGTFTVNADSLNFASVQFDVDGNDAGDGSDGDNKYHRAGAMGGNGTALTVNWNVLGNIELDNSDIDIKSADAGRTGKGDDDVDGASASKLTFNLVSSQGSLVSNNSQFIIEAGDGADGGNNYRTGSGGGDAGTAGVAVFNCDIYGSIDIIGVGGFNDDGSLIVISGDGGDGGLALNNDAGRPKMGGHTQCSLTAGDYIHFVNAIVDVIGGEGGDGESGEEYRHYSNGAKGGTGTLTITSPAITMMQSRVLSTGGRGGDAENARDRHAGAGGDGVINVIGDTVMENSSLIAKHGHPGQDDRYRWGGQGAGNITVTGLLDAVASIVGKTITGSTDINLSASRFFPFSNFATSRGAAWTENLPWNFLTLESVAPGYTAHTYKLVYNLTDDAWTLYIDNEIPETDSTVQFEETYDANGIKFIMGPQDYISWADRDTITFSSQMPVVAVTSGTAIVDQLIRVLPTLADYSLYEGALDVLTFASDGTKKGAISYTTSPYYIWIPGWSVDSSGTISDLGLNGDSYRILAENYVSDFFSYVEGQSYIIAFLKSDSDGDGIPNDIENDPSSCTDPDDADTDDDGITDGEEDINYDGIVDAGETDPCSIDSDGDGIQDGTEIGLTTGHDDTDPAVFKPDLDPSTTTDPLLADTDGDGVPDGQEDTNFNGRVDAGETDPQISEPFADAGPNQTIEVNETASLDGSASMNAESYEWSLVSKPSASSATLPVNDTVTVDFVPDVPGDYLFELVVVTGNGMPSQPDNVTVKAIIKAEKIVFSSNTGILSNLWLMDPAGNNQEQITFDDLNTYLNAKLSPDGEKVAFCSNKSGYSEVWIMTLSDSSMIQLTDLQIPSDLISLDWSPTGDRICFALRADSNPRTRIFIVNTINPGTPVEIFSGQYWFYDMDWIPTTETILFDHVTCCNNSSNTELFTINTDGTGLTQLTNNSTPDRWAAVSPDATQILYTQGLGDDHVRIMDIDGSNDRIIYNSTRAVSQGWSPDGSRLLISMENGGEWDIATINPDGTDLNVISISGHQSGADWNYVSDTYQSPGICTYEIGTTTDSFDETGGTGTVAVNSSLECCSWTAVSNDTWLTLTSDAAGSGDGTVEYSVDPNTECWARQGTLTVAGETFTVNQAARDSYGTTVYFQDFSADPSYTPIISHSAGSSQAYWTGDAYYAKVYDQHADWWCLGHSPAFTPFSTDNDFTVEFDFNPVTMDWGSYPGIYFHGSRIESKVDHQTNAEAGTLFHFRIHYSDSNYRKLGFDFSNASGDGTVYLTPSVPTDNEWYHVSIAYHSTTATADLLVLGSDASTFYQADDVPAPISGLFQYLSIGQVGSAPAYGNMSEVMVDNIVITVEVAPEVDGWISPQMDMTGSRYYKNGSGIATNDISQKWEYSMPGNDQQYILSGDVNGDGFLELVTVQDNTLYIFSSDGQNLLQQDVSISGIPNSRVTMLSDVNGDNQFDIGIGYSRGNNNRGVLKARLYEGDGTLLKEFTKTVSSDGELDPIAVFDGDIIIGQDSGYAGNPRGFSRWDYDSESEIWYFDVGPKNNDTFSFADINSDGLLEMSFNNWTPHNGASGNGTTDGDAYFIFINENGEEVLIRKYDQGNSNSGISNYFLQLSATFSDYQVLCAKHYSNSYPGTSRLHICDVDGMTLYSHVGLSNAKWSYAWTDMNSDGNVEIVAGNYNSSEQTLNVFDNQLNVLSSLNLASRHMVHAIVDADGDGENEIIVSTADGAVKGLDAQLNEKWQWDAPSGETIKNVIVSDNDNNGIIDISVLTDAAVYVLEGQCSAL